MRTSSPSSSIAAFVKIVGSKPELQAKLQVIQFKSEAEAIRELVLLSAEVGAPVSEEEWTASLQRMSKEELDDAALDKVAGGAGIVSWFASFLDAPMEIHMN